MTQRKSANSRDLIRVAAFFLPLPALLAQNVRLKVCNGHFLGESASPSYKTVLETSWKEQTLRGFHVSLPYWPISAIQSCEKYHTVPCLQAFSFLFIKFYGVPNDGMWTKQHAAHQVCPHWKPTVVQTTSTPGLGSLASGFGLETAKPMSVSNRQRWGFIHGLYMVERATLARKWDKFGFSQQTSTNLACIWCMTKTN